MGCHQEITATRGKALDATVEIWCRRLLVRRSAWRKGGDRESVRVDLSSVTGGQFFAPLKWQRSSDDQRQQVPTGATSEPASDITTSIRQIRRPKCVVPRKTRGGHLPRSSVPARAGAAMDESSVHSTRKGHHQFDRDRCGCAHSHNPAAPPAQARIGLWVED